MRTATRTRRPRQLQPATGTAVVLRPFGVVNDLSAEIAINGKPYYLLHTGHGFRLFGWDDRAAAVVVYDLPQGLETCDCPDSTFRQERSAGNCKHARALAALVTAGKLGGAA
jgi:hypothetical protein